MGKTRVTDEGMERRKAKLGAYQSHRERLMCIKADSERPSIKHFKESCEVGSKRCEKTILNLAKDPSPNAEQNHLILVQEGARLKVLDEILHDLRDTAGAIDKANQRIEEIRTQIKVASDEGLLDN